MELVHDAKPLRMSCNTLRALVAGIRSLLLKVAGNTAELIEVGGCHRKIGGSVAASQHIEPEQKRLEKLSVENLHTRQTVEEAGTHVEEFGADVAAKYIVRQFRFTWRSEKAVLRRLGSHGCAESPNDPKLSDGRARRGACAVGGKVAAEAGGVTRPPVRCSAWLGPCVERDETSGKGGAA